MPVGVFAAKHYQPTLSLSAECIENQWNLCVCVAIGRQPAGSFEDSNGEPYTKIWRSCTFPFDL